MFIPASLLYLVLALFGFLVFSVALYVWRWFNKRRGERDRAQAEKFFCQPVSFQLGGKERQVTVDVSESPYHMTVSFPATHPDPTVRFVAQSDALHPVLTDHTKNVHGYRYDSGVRTLFLLLDLEYSFVRGRVLLVVELGVPLNESVVYVYTSSSNQSFDAELHARYRVKIDERNATFYFGDAKSGPYDLQVQTQTIGKLLNSRNAEWVYREFMAAAQKEIERVRGLWQEEEELHRNVLEAAQRDLQDTRDYLVQIVDRFVGYEATHDRAPKLEIRLVGMLVDGRQIEKVKRALVMLKNGEIDRARELVGLQPLPRGSRTAKAKEPVS